MASHRIQIEVSAPNRIAPDSWLQADEYADFRRAYRYAATQSAAIPALAKCSPEEMYKTFEALKRGWNRGEPGRAISIDEVRGMLKPARSQDERAAG